MATREGTWGYRERFGDRFGRTYFRRFAPGVVSSVGVGTYLGDPTPAVDDAYREALVTALEHGCNLVDTAVNYRCGRSERVVGEALGDADVDRDAVVVATKGGFVPFDGERPADPGRYVRERFVDTGLCGQDDLAHGNHALAPAFVDAMVDRSLSNLGVDRIDCYYLHNPETQLAVRSRSEVYDAVEAAFRRLERRVAAGEVGSYGVATWDAFRVPEDHESYLSLPEVVRRADRAANEVGNDEPALSAVQLPFNVRMADAFTVEAHEGQSALAFAREAGLDVFTSASLGQGALTRPDAIPPAVAAELPGDTAAQCALNFARSAPGVTAALVGTKRPDHAAEALAAGTFDAMGARTFDSVFE
jgi:aryl-alcohol dehydrogenase-like predicted oxidoreductase